jgi:hypothetical protein
MRKPRTYLLGFQRDETHWITWWHAVEVPPGTSMFLTPKRCVNNERLESQSKVGELVSVAFRIASTTSAMSWYATRPFAKIE